MMLRKTYLLVPLVFVVLFICLLYCFFPIITHDYEKNKPNRIYLTDRNGIVITDKPNEFGYRIEERGKLKKEGKLIKSIIEIEDKNYYSHFGVNFLSKLRALFGNIKAGEITSGGSTITEQYVKNEFFPNSKRTYLQKAREAILALYFSIFTSKNSEQCHSELVSESFGEIINEVKGEYSEIKKLGFKKDPEINSGGHFITLKNCILASYLQNAYFGNNVYGLQTAIEVFFDKGNLDDLTDEEITLLISLIHKPSLDISSKEFEKYFNQVKERLNFDFERTIFTLPKPPNIDKFPFATNDFNNLAFPQGGGNKGEVVSIDANLQEFAEKVLNQTLKELKSKNVSNGAIFAINPKTNEVLLYIGSKNFYAKDIDGQVNVLKSPRQPGSTMKPFLYLLALEEGAGVNNLLVDLESQYNSFQEDKVYMSENYTLKEYGLVRLKKALGNSLNNASVRLARELGLQKVYNFYKSYGFDLPESPEYYGYSLVLGNPSITLMDLVYSYSKLLDFSDPNKFLLYQILSNPDNRDISFGVNSILNTSIYQAVKTGTSSNFRDNLVVSYHPDFVLGVWVGNNDNSSMIGITGITGAGYIWHQVVEEAIRLGYIKQTPPVLTDSPLIEGDKKLPPSMRGEARNEQGGVLEKPYCLDQNCFRKELNFDKVDKEYFSRIADGIYDERDVFGKLSQEERKYLEVLGFRLN